MKLPTDGAIQEPDDLEFYLGIPSRKPAPAKPGSPQNAQAPGGVQAAPPQPVASKVSLDGDFGHAMPASPAVSSAPAASSPGQAAGTRLQ